MHKKTSKTTVVNIYKDEYDVYIGRAGKGKSGYFGNPFYQWDRETNIQKFKDYFYNRIRNDHEFRKKVLELKGKRLGCFCHPKPCHGDVIAEYLNNLPEVEPLKLAVIGSRSFDDYEFMKGILDWYDIKQIISGGAKGADTLARKYAAEHSIDFKEFPAEWDKYGKSAGFVRNKLIVNAADEVMAFWDGQSKGTAHTIKLAKEKGKPVHIYTIQNQYIESDELSKWGS